MIKKILDPIYRFSHDFLFNTLDFNPFYSNNYGGKKVLKGHISDIHLQNPELDNKLTEELSESNIPVKNYLIDKNQYNEYLKIANYPQSYYGGGNDTKQNFTEKTTEHFVSLQFVDFKPETVFIDIAACTSPFYKMVKKLFGVKLSYQQDLIFEKGLHKDKIGGYASEIPLPDNSVDIVTLHCSLEHFEGDSDTEFFIEMERVLRKNEKVIILPFYLASEYTIHIDPAFNTLRFHRPKLDTKARLRYCNWYQFFSRHYDVNALRDRILNKTPNLDLEIFRVKNFLEIDKSCYLRFIGVFTKK
jgi:hypothetical protein